MFRSEVRGSAARCAVFAAMFEVLQRCSRFCSDVRGSAAMFEVLQRCSMFCSEVRRFCSDVRCSGTCVRGVGALAYKDLM